MDCKGWRWAWRVVVLALAVVLAGCSAQQRQAQIVVASSFASAANRAGDLLQRVYQQQGMAVIDKASTRAEADAGLAKVRSEWAPVWAAVDKVRAAQDVWATALEHQAKVDDINKAAGEVITAYCALDAAAKPLAPLPAVPGVMCPQVAP